VISWTTMPPAAMRRRSAAAHSADRKAFAAHLDTWIARRTSA